MINMWGMAIAGILIYYFTLVFWVPALLVLPLIYLIGILFLLAGSDHSAKEQQWPNANP